MFATLSQGNQKLGSVVSVSLPPIITCGKKLPCFKDCYGHHQYKQYPNVRLAYDRNLRRWKANPDRYFGSIIWQIKKRNVEMFRWHVAGDIPAKSYIDGIIRVGLAVPDCRFLLFTKRYDWVAGIRFPKNVSVILSVWPGLPLPKSTRPRAFLQNGLEKRAQGALSCPGGCETCGRCWVLPKIKRDVVFPLHAGWIASLKARKAS